MATGYTLEELMGMYRAECILPASPALAALTDEFITPNVDAIVRDMFELRAEADAHFLRLLAQPRMVVRPDEGVAPGSTRYPISFCLEITRHMLKLMSRQPVAAHMTGLRALHDFVRAGGPVKRVWGALRGGYFQNAIQVGTFYLDVANDTVTPTKPKVEMLKMADANFNNINSFFEYARVGAAYWKARIIPNTFFPNVAPFLPAIVFDKDGSVRLEGRNSYLFPMNIDKGHRPARDFIMHEGLDAATHDMARDVLRVYAALDPRCADPSHPLWFRDTAPEERAAGFEAVATLGPVEFIAEVNRVLGPDSQFDDSAMRQCTGAAARLTPATTAEG